MRIPSTAVATPFALLTLLPLPYSAVMAACNTQLAESTPSSEFVLNSDGTATHTRTGLIWSRCSLGQLWQAGSCTRNPQKETFASASVATQRANAEHYLGYSSWRLPSSAELQEIVEFQCSNPAINGKVFPNTPSSWFWSSTNYWEFPFYGQPVDFGNGNDYIFYKIKFEDNPYPVRLVRTPSLTDPQALGVDSDDDGVSDALEVKQGTNPRLKDNDIRLDERFMAQLYRDVLYREATELELSQQRQLLQSNPDRVARIIALASTEEFKTQRLDLAAFAMLSLNNQIANRASLNTWRNNLNKGQTSTTQVASFIQSSDLQQRYVSATNAEYGAALGGKILGRNITEAEFATALANQFNVSRAVFSEQWLASETQQARNTSLLTLIQIAALLSNSSLDIHRLTELAQQVDAGSLSFTTALQWVLQSDAYKQRFMP